MNPFVFLSFPIQFVVFLYILKLCGVLFILSDLYGSLNPKFKILKIENLIVYVT